jgi:hypothetical protein
MSKSAEQMRQMEDMIQGLRQQVDILDKKPAAVIPPALALPPPPAPMPAQAPCPYASASTLANTRWGCSRESLHGAATASKIPRNCLL